MLWIVGALSAAWLVVWSQTRGTRPAAQEPHAFTRAEIASYRAALPKYLLASSVCLLLGGAHSLLVQLPAVHMWLQGAGEASYLLVEGVRQQLVVVGGVVMLGMGLTCYALPSLIGRPVRHHNLARLSFVLVLSGVLLTALMAATIGLLEGFYIHTGGTYAAARAWLGPWERFPLWLFVGARDAGYWTFALLVALTVYSGRNIIWPRHRRRLTLWLLFSAGALFLVGWQSVLHALPGNPLLLPQADAAALLVSSAGYEHLHLGAGAWVPVALATLVYLLERRAERRTDWQRAYRVLGRLAAAASLSFLLRLAFNLSGSLPIAAALHAALAPWQWLVQGAGGLLFLAALATYAACVVSLARASRSYLPRAITGTLIIGVALCLVAGVHGAVLSLLPAPFPWPNREAHGLLAVGTALLLPALTLADTLLLDTAGARLTARLAQAGLGFVGAGIALAYLARLGLGGPAGAVAAAGLQLAGFLTFALHTLDATADYRQRLRERLRALPPANPRPAALRLLALPRSQVLLIELLAGLAGFPGFGWLFAGYTLTSILLLCIGPAVAWALLPSLFTLSQGWPLRLGWSALLVYLPLSALGSAWFLRSLLVRKAQHEQALRDNPREARDAVERAETGE